MESTIDDYWIVIKLNRKENLWDEGKKIETKFDWSSVNCFTSSQVGVRFHCEWMKIFNMTVENEWMAVKKLRILATSIAQASLGGIVTLCRIAPTIY